MASRKRCILNMQQRLDVLEELDSSQPVSAIAAKYGVHPTTVRSIRRNAASVRVFADKNKLQRKRQIVRKPMYDEVEQRLVTLFLERRALGDIVTDALMLQKAAEIKENVQSSSRFKISMGWLANVKRRHGIRLVRAHGEKESADVDAATSFVHEMKKIVEEENINPENIYNMDESGLLWKAVPSRTLAGEQEKSVSGFKVRKERITFALCANATGNHKLMPLVIYKYKNPRALKHCQNRLPVVFKSQANAWVDRSVFSDWYNNYFKPAVRGYQLEKRICGKLLLLLDNFQGHKISEEEDPYFKIVYMPANATSILQPMDQGLIEKTKRLFRHRMLECVLTYEGGTTEFYKKYTIKDCIDLLHKSWTEISTLNIRNSWRKIMSEINITTDDIDDTHFLENEMQSVMSQLDTDISHEQMTQFLSTCDEAERILINDQPDSEEESPAKEEESDEEELDEEKRQKALEEVLKKLKKLTKNEASWVKYHVKGLEAYLLNK